MAELLHTAIQDADQPSESAADLAAGMLGFGTLWAAAKKVSEIGWW